MYRDLKYGKIWDLDVEKGQIGLLNEDHYRPLFAFPQQRMSFRPEDVWIDIGANIGAFAIRAAEFVKMVYAAEPEEENLKCLHRNLGLNSVMNVDVWPFAVVGGDETTVPLALSNNFSSTHRIGNIRGRKTIDVPAVNINALLQETGANKVKIDAEGSEAEILEAMDLSPVDEIVFEYHFSMLKDYDWSRFYAIIHRLEAAGLEIKKQPSAKSKTWHTIVWAKRTAPS